MPRTCSSCSLEGPLLFELDRRLKSGSTLPDCRRWLAERDVKTSINALSRHRSHTLPTRIPSGPRPAGADLLELVRDSVVRDVEEGIQHPNITQGLQAVKQLDDRAARGKDQDLMLKIALALGGVGYARVVSPEVDVIEGEFRALRQLPAGDEGGVHVMEEITAGHAEARRARERG